MPTPQPISRYILAYLFWAVTVVLTVIGLLTLRETMMILSALTGWDRLITHAINQFGFLLLAVITLSVVIFCEHFYRTAVEKQRLWSRFLFVLFVMVGILAICHVIQMIGEMRFGIPIPSFSYLLTLAEVVLTGLFYWGWRQAKAKTVQI